MGIGIEKINVYGGSLVLDIEKLAIARGRDVKFFKEVYTNFLTDS
jgi:3-hydroxy-3-methylglutaryl CoA synthase